MTTPTDASSGSEDRTSFIVSTVVPMVVLASGSTLALPGLTFVLTGSVLTFVLTGSLTPRTPSTILIATVLPDINSCSFPGNISPITFPTELESFTSTDLESRSDLRPVPDSEYFSPVIAFFSMLVSVLSGREPLLLLSVSESPVPPSSLLGTCWASGVDPLPAW